MRYGDARLQRQVQRYSVGPLRSGALLPASSVAGFDQEADGSLLIILVRQFQCLHVENIFGLLYVTLPAMAGLDPLHESSHGSLLTLHSSKRLPCWTGIG